jgi:hypothetical protein
MKTTTLPIKAFLAAIAAIAFLPVGPGAAAIAFTVTGLLAIVLADYGREVQPLEASSNVVPFDFTAHKIRGLDRAA